jgi:hypothetical protein
MHQHSADAREELLLSFAQPIDGSRALIVAGHGLDLLRALIHHCCVGATCLRPSVRPEAAAHDLAFFLDITPATDLEMVVRSGLRAVVPGGRIVAEIVADPTGRAARGLARRLRLNGFTAVRTRHMFGRTVVRGDRPAFVGGIA